MGRVIEPLTVGYDWEMAVLKRTGESVGEGDVERLSDELRRRLPWGQPGTDLELIESRIGCVTSFRELLRKSERFDAALRSALSRREWSLLRAGTRPFEREPIGSHIHVGTFSSWGDAMRVQNGMARYVAPLAALMANSPVYRARAGEYKSYRVASFAEWCSIPQQLVAPEYAQPSWGGDVCSKLAWGSTVELRVGDGASCTRAMCEFVALVAGLMWHVAECEQSIETTRDDYNAMMLNRWRAAKYGLQAVFIWENEERPADQVLTTMVGLAEDGMRLLGIGRSELRLVRKMLAKRQTQADFQLAVLEAERGDPYRFTRAFANIQRDPRAFERYLRRAPALAAVEPADPVSDLVRSIGKETPYPVLLRATPLPPAELDRVLAAKVAEGVLTETRSSMGTRLFTRQGVGA
jgi:gamma-glutamyl:cysteine ligase YbdK (ATP-grasp superfamily)